MKNRIIFFLIILLATSLNLLAFTQESSIDELLDRIKNSLKMKNAESYLENFLPEKREEEREKINYLRPYPEVNEVTIFKVKNPILAGDKGCLFLQVFFHNSYFVTIETWQLELMRKDGRWLIADKKVSPGLRELYKIKIPADKIEKVKLIEIEHVDIKLIFKDALLFYDNIPEEETALLVIGRGRFHFSPSDPKEKHQLELLYKKDFLEDKLNYCYLRFSDSFFKRKIKIYRQEGRSSYHISKSEINRAYSLFVKHYPRSFTIENSWSKELLSFLPQGDEAVFEFEGQKIGKFSYVYSPLAREEVSLYKWKGEKIINLYSPMEEKELPKLYVSFGRKFDINDYDIAIDFNPKDCYLSGKAKVGISSLVSGLDGLKLKFNPNLEILGIFDEEKRQLFFTKDKLRKILYIYFFLPLPKGKNTSVEIFYRGKIIPPRQIADVLRSGQFNETLIFIPPKYDTYLYSQSSYWYPAPNTIDYFQARLRIIVPPDYRCIANGQLVKTEKLRSVEKVEEIEKVGSTSYTFQTKRPLKYLSFIVGKFIEVEKDLSSLPLLFLRSSDLIYQKGLYLKEAEDILNFYTRKFGPYPYEKLTIVQRIWPTSGGHSPASFIILNELPRIPGKGRLVSRASPVDFSRWKEYFIAHEIAHQWWGQAVTWRTYHDQWLSEGLAQFSSILYLKEKYGERDFMSIVKTLSRWVRKKSEWGSIIMGSRLSYFDFEAYQAIIYDKSSLILNMLKDLLGEKRFFDGLRKFFSEHKYQAATTADFFHTFQRVSDFELKPFFEGWFKSHDLPQVRSSYSVVKKDKKYFLEFSFSQPKSFFIFPLWIEWNLEGKKIIKKLIIKRLNNRFSFWLEAKPKKIKINSYEAVPGKFY